MIPALEIKDLRKKFGALEVVKGLSLTVEPGEIFGLLGPNGAGKSTTINMIGGVCRIGSGSVRIFGACNQADFVTTRRWTGVMHQEIVVDNFFPIGTALKFHSGYYGVPDDAPWREKLIERLDLGPHLKKPMNRLSGGMKRRFMVAKALIHRPRLLILDEPTAGVDVELRKALWDFVREINRDRGTTVILTTHYLEEAEQMCGRVAILDKGALVALDRTRNLQRQMHERKIFVHLETPISEIPPALHEFQCELQEGGEVLRISSHTSAQTVLEKLVTARLPVRDLETRLPSLEEVFLHLTRRKDG